MNCQQINKLLERYDEGDLPSSIAIEVESHLQSCTNCQTLLKLVKKERTSLQSYTDIPELTPEFASALMARISVAPRPRLVPIWVEWTRRYPTLLGAAAVILLFLFPLLGQPYRNDEIVPLAPKTAQKMAAVDLAQNVPFGAVVQPAPAISEDTTYRGESRQQVREDPSRSPQAKGLNAENNTSSTKETAPSLRKVGITNLELMASLPLPPAVVPSYIPSGYSLDKIEVIAENQVVISYLSASDPTATPLIINIMPDIPSSKQLQAETTAVEDETLPSRGEEPSRVAGAPATITTASAEKSPTESLSVVCDGQSYIISTSIPLEPEEMESLSRSLAPRQP